MGTSTEYQTKNTSGTTSFELKVRKLYTQWKVDKGLLSNIELELKVLDTPDARIIQAFTRLLTMEDELHEYPADWWQAFKDRWFPAWLKRRYPVHVSQVWAVHKFPELNCPKEMLGKEFVHLEIRDAMPTSLENTQ